MIFLISKYYNIMNTWRTLLFSRF